jgi:hypothetical protein
MLSRFLGVSSFIVAGALVAWPAFGQTPNPPPTAPLPPGSPPAPQAQPTPTYPQPQTYQQPAPGYQPAVPPGSQPQQQAQPAYQQPAYQQQQQPGYQQPPPGYQQPPPGYQQPGYPPPGYPQQPGYQPYPYYQQPTYSQPLPPPPVVHELKWSVRFNLFDLLFGSATAELEYAFAGPFSLTIAPQYIFADPRQDRNSGITASGFGFYGELGVWVNNRPLRGYFLKGHAGHANVNFHGDVADVPVPSTHLGVLFGSQSIYGDWFTLSWGIGVAVDTQSKEWNIRGHDTRSGNPIDYTIAASGIFGNGWDLLSQIGLGGSF